jgi:hypothetical protein
MWKKNNITRKPAKTIADLIIIELALIDAT